MFGYRCEDCDADETLKVQDGRILCLACRLKAERRVGPDQVADLIRESAEQWLSYVNLPDESGPQYKVTMEEGGTLNLSPVDPDDPRVHPGDTGGVDFRFRVEVERQ